MFALFHGKNSFLSKREAQTKYEELSVKFSNYTSKVLNADLLETEEIVKEYQTSDMFGGGKVLLIKRLYKNRNKAEIFENISSYLSNMPEDTHILIWEDQKIPSNTNYFKFFKSAKNEFESADLNKRSFVTWAKSELDKHALKIDNKLLYTLAENSNYDAERFCNLVEKLKLKGKKEVSSTDIEDISISTFEFEIWSLLDAINGKEGLNPFEILDRLLSQKVEPLFILTMLARNSRQLILIREMLDNGADSKSIASKLRIPPFTLPTLIKSAQSTSFEKLTLIYKKLYNLDYEIKTGNIEPDLGLTLLMTIL